MLPTPRRRARPDPRSAAAASDRPHPRRRRLRRGHQLPVRGRRRLRPARAARRRRTPAHGAPGQPALDRGAVLHHDAAAGPAQDGRPQPGPRRPGGVAVRDRHGRLPGRPWPGADLRGRPAAHRRRARPAPAGHPGPAAAPGGRPRRGARARWLVGGGPSRPAGPTRSASSAALAAELGVDVEVRAASLAPWHPGRCAEILVGDAVLGHAGELHPKVCQAFGHAARSAAVEIDLDVLLSRAPRRRAGPGLLHVPARQGGRRARRSTQASRWPRSRTPCASGAGDLLESIRLFDVYTGEQVGAGQKSLAFALRFRAARPHPHRGRDRRGPRRSGRRRGGALWCRRSAEHQRAPRPGRRIPHVER